MKHRAIVASITMIASSWLAAAAAQQAHPETDMTKVAIEIPESIRLEHEAIHSALVAACSMRASAARLSWSR